MRACWSSPFFAKDGSVLGTFAISHAHCCAPTEQDHDLLQTAAHLAGIAVERDKIEQALERQTQMLLRSERLSAMGQLAAGISHDFNNLLTAIMGFSVGVRDSLAKEDTRRTDLDEVLVASERAKELTTKLLAFSRGQGMNPTRLDLNGLVHDVATLLKRMVGEDIELSTAPASVPAVVRAERARNDHAGVRGVSHVPENRSEFHAPTGSSVFALSSRKPTSSSPFRPRPKSASRSTPRSR